MHCRLLIALLWAFSARGETNTSHQEPLVRIGLVKAFASADTLYVSVPAGAKLICGDGEAAAIRGPGTWRVSRGESGGLVVRAHGPDGDAELHCTRLCVQPGNDSADEPMGIALSPPDKDPAVRSRFASRGRGGRRQSGVTHFRGALEIAAAQNGGLLAVNMLPLEQYIRGVVRLEIGADAPAEAIKAQAVAARTYALKSRGRFARQGYDLTDTTVCQAYGGVEAESAATDSAVQDTRGLVLTRGGKLILADYYDDCGGVTAAGDDDADFPPSVVDKPEDGAPDYCKGGRCHAWILEVTADDMSRVARSVAGWPSSVKLADIQVASMDASGRALKVRLTAEGGQTKDVRASTFRAAVGYEKLKSTLFQVHKTDAGFVFEGRGYGHGRGMCQAGAIGMASPPYLHSFREILGHYFPGATVQAWSEAAPVRTAVKR